MKRVIMFMLSAMAEGAMSAGVTAANTPVVKVYTSEKLTQLRADKKAAWDALMNQDPEKGKVFEYDSEDFLKQQLEVFKIGKLIDGEIAQLKAAEAEAEMQIKRNERLALNAAQFDAYDAMLAVNADKKATPEAKAEAAEKFRIAKEAVDNELLSKFGKTPVKNAGESNGAGERGNTSAEIKTKLLGYIAEGKTATEAVKLVIGEGYSRGTVGSVRTAMKVAGEIAD